MPFTYDSSFTPSFPSLPLVVIAPDNMVQTSVLVGLVDSGADVTLVPMRLLQMIEAEEIYRAYLRSHWGERRTVAIYLVDLEVAGHVLPGIEVIGDDLSDVVLLGRNVLNRLILLLDGPAGEAAVLTKPPQQR